MTAEELMIGDWVHSPEFRCNSGTDPEMDRRIKICDFLDRSDGTSGVDRYTPITITEEILNANGFRLIVDKENNYCGGIIKNDDITVWVHLGDRYNYHTRIVNHKLLVTEEIRLDLSIRYVHELQHALRLCGLNGLANNFKIE